MRPPPISDKGVIRCVNKNKWQHLAGRVVVVWKVIGVSRKEERICTGKFVCFRRGWFYIDCGVLPFMAFPQGDSQLLGGDSKSDYVMREPV